MSEYDGETTLQRAYRLNGLRPPPSGQIDSLAARWAANRPPPQFSPQYTISNAPDPTNSVKADPSRGSLEATADMVRQSRAAAGIPDSWNRAYRQTPPPSGQRSIAKILAQGGYP